ncbi:hypothetical protein EJ110_NYTH26640 [Nymphaea thermarum]|nr:hypothetical protein EJ110_NYTH26640 [Nymphaea thermarum]
MVAESDSHQMCIPADAPNGSVPKKTCEVKLEDPGGRQWPVKLLIWISSKKTHSLPRMERTLSSGWHNFFEANCLKKVRNPDGHLILRCELRRQLFVFFETVTDDACEKML